MNIRWALFASVTLSLTACERAAPEPDPQPTTGTAEEAGATDEPVSIIRPEVEVAREIPPLEPIEERISFDDGGFELSEAAEEELKTLLATRQMAAGGAITLRGHTDSAGSDEANLRASERRAELVRDWLVENEVAEDRITVIAIGEQNPAQPNANPDGSPNEEGRAYNRRVMVSVAIPPELAKKPRSEETPSLVEQVSAPD